MIELSSVKKRCERPIFPIGLIFSCLILPLTTGIDTFFWICIITSPIAYFTLFFWNQDIWIKENNLIVKSLFRKELISITNIESISENKKIITIRLKNKSKFGYQIKFYPKLKNKLFRKNYVFTNSGHNSQNFRNIFLINHQYMYQR